MKYLLIVMLTLTSCTDAQASKLTQLGSSQEITCYSGGMVIYNGFSTGKVAAEKGGSGHFFTELGTGDLVEVLGNCIFRSATKSSKLGVR